MQLKCSTIRLPSPNQILLEPKESYSFGNFLKVGFASLAQQLNPTNGNSASKLLAASHELSYSS